jgi:hypothetical protein
MRFFVCGDDHLTPSENHTATTVVRFFVFIRNLRTGFICSSVATGENMRSESCSFKQTTLCLAGVFRLISCLYFAVFSYKRIS